MKQKLTELCNLGEVGDIIEVSGKKYGKFSGKPHVRVTNQRTDHMVWADEDFVLKVSEPVIGLQPTKQ